MATRGHKLLAAGTALLIAEPALALAHTGGVGVIAGLALGAIAYHAVDDVEKLADRLPTDAAREPRAAQESAKPSLAYRLFNGKSTRQASQDDAQEEPAPQEENNDDPQEAETTETQTEEETMWRREQAAALYTSIPRISIAEMVAHTERNSYQVWIGRSLTRQSNPAVCINFYKRHIKIIGASQHGKSSMAAALLESIIRTHDRQHVLLALLDLEDKTSRLFANCENLMRVRLGTSTESIKMHARTYEEVLHRLEVLSSIIDARYKLTAEQGEEVLDTLPIILVYLEEFIDLKNYFKHRRDGATKDEKEQATKDYERLVYCIGKIAARGLKVLVQFLMCAQVDYRDEDLQPALVNVTSGMSFCVRPTAAAAAGFYRTELLKRNAMEDQVGQCVVEMPDCKDLILAPDYDLRARLRALSERERRTIPVYKKLVSENAEMPISNAGNEPGNGSTSHFEAQSSRPRLPLLVNDAPERETPVAPAGNENVNVAPEVKEIIKRMHDAGMKHGQIARMVKLDGRNYPTYKQVCHELGIAEKEA